METPFKLFLLSVSYSLGGSCVYGGTPRAPLEPFYAYISTKSTWIFMKLELKLLGSEKVDPISLGHPLLLYKVSSGAPLRPSYASTSIKSSQIFMKL